MKLPIAGFDWDDGNAAKCRKHGLHLEQIERFLAQPSLRILADAIHSVGEPRFLAAGELDGRFLFVGFTLRSKAQGIFIRPISARYMHEKEAKRYAQESSGI
jgi:uncharacterized protein